MTIRQLAAKTDGVSERCIRRAVRSGDLPIYRPPGSWPRIRRSDFNEWLASQRSSCGDTDAVGGFADALAEALVARLIRALRGDATGVALPEVREPSESLK